MIFNSLYEINFSLVSIDSKIIFFNAKGLVAKLASPHAQSAWGFGGKGFELRG